MRANRELLQSTPCAPSSRILPTCYPQKAKAEGISNERDEWNNKSSTVAISSSHTRAGNWNQRHLRATTYIHGE